ncbi:Methyltransferase domain-containing protein [Thiohalomonas denitrificans]|uniref:Methyltransferase domain-containing protein n=2 Tax=Thiohalomonas denitrificans TaxID=415747 RepID=A0A1G5QZS6_9GAMM|nr:Methyltransferase domain-containing protein [Thiohalomonas denitrificans]
MATLNPKGFVRRFFPTARRLLVEADVRRWCVDEYARVLVIGAGHDPYRTRFPSADLYVTLDIVSTPGATDVVASALELPFQNGVFDCVVAIEIAEHVNEPLMLIKEAFRVLAPSGSLLLSVPFAFHQHADPEDYWRPTRRALEKAGADFKEVSVYPQGNRLHVMSDFSTTAFYPRSVFAPLRIINNLLRIPFLSGANRKNTSSAPSGHFMVAKK